MEFPNDEALSICLKRDYALLNRTKRITTKGVARALTNRGFHATFLYRMSRWLWLRSIPFLPEILTRLAQHLYAIDIAYTASIGPGLLIFHGFGIVIGSEVRIAGDCVLFQGVTMGDRGTEWVGSRLVDGHPQVGRGCLFSAGAKVLGKIRVEDNCVVGANSVLLRDLPPNSVAAGLPAKIINSEATVLQILSSIP